MNTTLQAWQRLGSSARNTLAWARGLYQARLTRSTAAHAQLEHWRWLTASAEACVEEARRLHLEGLESLLATGVGVRREAATGVVRYYTCRALDSSPDGSGAEELLRFQNGLPDPGQAALRERVFGGVDEELLRAFGEGLTRLDALGAFDGTAELELRPDSQQLPANPVPRRRAAAASRWRQRRLSPALPLRQA